MDRMDIALTSEGAICYIRHSIDTRDEFYDEEVKFWNQFSPVIQEYIQEFNKALYENKFRKELAAEFGEIIFTNIELKIRSFCVENIPLMQRENDLTQEYDKLIASAQIPFEAGAGEKTFSSLGL